MPKGFNSFAKKERASGGIRIPAWWEDGLTFWAPFMNKANPLQLRRGTGALSFTRATDASFLNPDTGLIEMVGSGNLRIEAGGALIEGARTNICLQSAALGTTWVPTNITVGDDNVASPDGGTNAELLTASAGNGTLIQDLGVIASAAKTFSIYLKRKTGTGNIDLTLNGGVGWTTVAVTSSWARYSITATLADPDVGIRIVTSGDEVWAWGTQVEAASFVSSYIPTTSAAVTRNADVLTLPESGNISSTIGSAFTEFDVFIDSTHNQSLLGWDGTMPIYCDTERPLKIFDSTTWAGVPNSPPLLSAANRGATRWSGSEKAACLNGGSIGTSSFDGSLGSGAITIGGGFSGHGPHKLHIKNLRIWNRALSDSELQSITS